jgi:hypothetical protein
VGNLMISRVIIQVAEGVFSQREMILPGAFVKLSIINAHSPTSDGPLRNEFIFLILDDHHTTLLWHHLHWTYPLSAIG